MSDAEPIVDKNLADEITDDESEAEFIEEIRTSYRRGIEEGRRAKNSARINDKAMQLSYRADLSKLKKNVT